MPETRSKNSRLDQPTESAEETESATTTESSTGATSATTTEESGTTTTATEKDLSPSKTVRSAARDKSPRSKKLSGHALRLAKAKQEMLRLQIEFAAARVAIIEAEAYEETEQEDAVPTEEEIVRVDTWVNQQRHMLAIANEPHCLGATPTQVQQRTTEPVPTEGTSAQSPVANAIGETITAPPPTNLNNRRNATSTLPPNKESQACTTTPAGGSNAAFVQPQANSISDLAAAITMAVRSPRHATELPIYNGSHQEWLSFKTAYIETATAYSQIENIGRLRRSLRGRAREAVESLLIYSAPPQDIMKMLESRFGRPDSIALIELDKLRALTRPSDALKDVCTFASRVSNIIATLRALKKIHYLYNPEITKIVIEKLTPALRYRWTDFAAEHIEEEADLLKLSRFLEREAERCGPYAQPETNLQYADTNAQPKRTQRTHTTTEQNHEKRCGVCNQTGHGATSCEQFLKAETNERWDIAKKQKLCFRCLKYRNRSHNCRSIKCLVNDCQQWHNKLLHYEKKETAIETNSEVVTSTWTPIRSQSYLKIVPVCASGPRGNIDTFALLDDGSTVTLIDSDLAEMLGTRGKPEPLLIEAIASTAVDASTSRRITLTLKGATDRHTISARTIDRLQLSPQIVKESDLSDCRHLDDISQKLKYGEVKPKILIGQDNWHLLITKRVKKGNRNQPIASLTALGWVLHGARTRTLGQRVNYVNYLSDDEDLNEQLRQHFAIESLTITPRRPTHDPEERALAILSEATKRTETGHYETALLWREERAIMPNNYDNSYRRLLSTERKIDRNPDLKHKYEEQMEALVQKGYAERAPIVKQQRTWYLPHFPVLNPMKPGKVRVVHDAAAKTCNVSLNDKLLTGPDLLQSLPGVMMRLRQYPIAVSADIAEMFMQVKIREQDRDALRYLWRGNRRGDNQPDEYRMTSLIFGATSSPASAIYVKNKNAERYRESEPEAYSAIINNHYVDDYIQSFKTVEKAIEISKRVREIHREAHFELRQWASNSTELLSALGVMKKTQENIELNDGVQSERILGLIWKPDTDVIAFNLNLARLPPEILNSDRTTKREALRITMSLFDPLGLAAPVTTRAKQILQEMWRRGTDWDELIDADLAVQWKEWITHLRKLQEFNIPRCYPEFSNAASIQLHVFVDASEVAYAAATYWRVETADGRVATTLVIAKAKVAPLKIMSIPRLELQAAVMGCRLADTVLREHDVKPHNKTFWTDSKTVLSWLKNGARSYKPFVAHRIAAIEDCSTIREWRWVPTKLNVADDATRDVPHDLDSRHRWFTGPEFLRQRASEWPSETPRLIESTGEERVTHLTCKRTPIYSETVPDSTRFSKWERLLRSTARVLQFIRLCRVKKEKACHMKRNAKNKREDPTWSATAKPLATSLRPATTRRGCDNAVEIDADTLRAAENILVRSSQEQSFPEELRDVKNDKIVNSGSRLRPLAIELIDNIICLKTRIGRTQDISEEVKKPIVLDGNHNITKLYIDYTHRTLHHAGTEATVNECRQHYWILRLRTIARAIIHRCLPCRIRKASPGNPPTGDHPYNRLAHHRRPFTYTGIDYFGPISIKIGRTAHKRYAVLFTCLTSRAVHLEVAASLDTNSAVMALRRMIARRGCPTEIWSDNGTNLRGAEKELRKSADEAMANECQHRMIRWRFIPPGAPFMGGAWERLVRSVKSALNIALQHQQPTEEMLHTVLAEAEYTVNSRPLTHVSVEPEDMEAITPNHFILGGSARIPTPGTFTDSDLLNRSHWRATQRLADIFWARWIKEYLPELQHRREPHGKGQIVKIDDVVIIADSNLPRNTWPRGIVIQLYPGADGIVRAVDVRTKGGILRRPVKKLIVLPAHRERPSTQEDTLPADNVRRENVRDESSC